MNNTTGLAHSTSGERILKQIIELKEAHASAKELLHNLNSKLANIVPSVAYPPDEKRNTPESTGELMNRIEFGLDLLGVSGDDILADLRLANEMVDQVWLLPPEGKHMAKSRGASRPM